MSLAADHARVLKAVPLPRLPHDLAALSLVRALVLSTSSAVHFVNTHAISVDWAEEAKSLHAFHGVATDDHCLHASAHDWLSPLERQATEGLAHFLNPPSRKLKLARVAAFFRALPPPPTGWPESIQTAVVLTEHRTRRRRAGGSEGRIDLIVAAGDETRFKAAVIEAKFGHDLSSNPLGDYVRAAEAMKLPRDACAFLVLGVEKDPVVRERLKRNPLWRFVGWRRLLRALEAEMQPDLDDQDYRRFRRTLFARIH